MGNSPFILEELYESLGICDLPALERQRLMNLIAHWRLCYKTEDGRLGSDLVEYPDAEADLDTMAQKFLDHERTGQTYWRYDKQKVRYEEDADEIRRLLGRVFFQKNFYAARNARQKEEYKRRSNNIAPVAPILPVASYVAVSDETQSQDQYEEMSSDDLSYCESAVSDYSCDTLRRSKRKRAPSKKRQKIAHSPVKPNRKCNRCKRHHTKCNGAERCVRCTKSREPCVYDTPASAAGLKTKEDIPTDSAEVGPGAESASIASSPAPEPGATALPSPAATGNDITAQRTAATTVPGLTRFPSSDWPRELVPSPETDTVEELTHQREGTHTGGKDQTPKPNLKITFMVINEDQRGKKIKRCWRDGSLSGKSLGEVFHEAEGSVGRVGVEQIDFELEGLNTIFSFSVGDEESFESMRDEFNTETIERRKKGCWKFKIWLTLKGGIDLPDHNAKGGIDLGDHRVENPTDEQGEFKNLF